MRRRTFLEIGGKAALLTAMLPSTVFAGTSVKVEKYTLDQLLGRDDQLMVGTGYRLQQEVADAFEKMKAAAAEEGIKMHSQSSYRSFAHQKRIWDRKYDRFTGRGMSEIDAIRKIIEYSTIPGTSRHHWGTDLDIIDKSKPVPSDPLSATHFQKGKLYEKLHFWMQENSAKYGFHLVYTNAPGRKGFKYEPWHFTYSKISIPMLECYQELDFEGVLKELNIKGSKHFTSDFVAQYLKENILDINPILLP